MSFENGCTGAPFAQTQKDLQEQDWIQFREQGGDALPAMQRGEPQIHQISHSTHHAEPSLHQPLLYQQVFSDQQTEAINQVRGGGPFTPTEEYIQRQANWIQLREQHGGTLPATQQGTPHIHQIFQATQSTEPGLHQPLPSQQRVFSNQQTEETSLEVIDFKKQVSLARVKKLMKADEDVKMVAAEAPAVLGKACELFIKDLSLQSWIHANENQRRTLKRNDIADAIIRTDYFDFLTDIVQRSDTDQSRK